MKWELFKKSCQFRTKNFRQHGDNIRAAIHFEDQEFAMFTSGIESLVLSFTDNEGEATNICLVHIDPHGKSNISIQLSLKTSQLGWEGVTGGPGWSSKIAQFC